MIYNQYAEDEAREADFCVIGGGPAAITVVLELLKTDASIVLLVGGSPTHETAAAQDLNRGVIARPGSHEGLEENRRRVFGGASSAWGGRCIPFDPLDFKVRPWVPLSGWPLTYEELEPYYEKALHLCRAGSYVFDSRVSFPKGMPDIIPGLDGEDLEGWHLERWSPPINFAKEFRQILADAKGLRVYLNTHLTQLECTDTSETVSVAHVTSNGKRFRVRAKRFVLATGGIENARLLLASKSSFHPSGIGNEQDLVGRCYQAHPHGTYIALAPRDRTNIPYDYEKDSEGVYCRRRWWIPEATQQRLGINNIIFFLDHTNSAHGHRDAIFSTVFIAKALRAVMRTHGLGGRWKKLKELAPSVRQHLGVVARDGLAALPRLLTLGRARLGDRRLPSVLPSVRSTYLGLYYQAEQVPNKESRITLSPDQVDEHSVPRAVVNLAFTEQDIRTVVEAHELFVKRYRAADAGTILYEKNLLLQYVRQRFLNFNSGAHHLGTTRMAISPEDGVIDANCKVHKIDNLYVAGSSCFPTGGHANPTLTIVALALRLGGHLRTFHQQDVSPH